MNTFSDPAKIVPQFNLEPGAHVADFGSGSGAYPLAIARQLGTSHNSRIFAIDVQKDLLTRLDRQAQDDGLGTINIIWGDIEQAHGTHLRDDSIDFVLIANTLFQVDDKPGVLKEAYRILKPGGRLAVIDWAESFGNMGPEPNRVLNEATARLLCEEADLVFDRSLEAGEHHYGFITRKL